MKERLRLKNFGPIKEMDIEIKPLMVFIGESASGKSAILKLMSLLRWVHKQNNLRTYFAKSRIAKKADYSRLRPETLVKTSGLDEFISPSTVIRYEVGETIYEKVGKIPTDAKIKDDLTLEKIAFISENRGVLPDIYANKIPRGFKLPYYLGDTYDNFLSAFEVLERKEFFIESTKLTLFQKKGVISRFFIKGKNAEGKDFEIKFENSSSGTKTALYPEIIVDYLTQKYDFKGVLDGAFTDFLKDRLQQLMNVNISFKLDTSNFSAKNLSIFIEEPELSLFPSAQRRLINRLVKDCFSNNQQKDCTTRLAFATHSPYILTSLNNLLLAGEIAKENPQKSQEIENIIPKEYWLTTHQLGAYAIENGEVKSIIDSEENLINGAYLDNVSYDISTEFSQLLDIQYGN